jgi:Ca2+-binding RTX toxin-like protein
VDANGDPQIYVTVNNIAIPYDPSTTTLLSFNLGGGSDFLFTAPGVTVPILVDAGDGNDTVTTGDGTDAVIGGAGNDVIHGGAGADVLLGGLGRDSLYGDNDRDLLIGGADKDYVDGGSGEDIVIGGTTAWDNNGTALNGIITEWTSLTPNADRINHIRNGGGINGSFTLKVGSGATVFDDAAKDSLVGGSERDWFFRRATGTADSILGNIAGEEVNNV